MLMKEHRIAPLLRALSIIPFLASIASVPTALVTASMDFRIFTIRTFVATILGGVVGCTMAWKGWGAYSLIGQQVVFQGTMSFVVWKGCGWRPKCTFDLASLRTTIGPGLGNTGSMIVTFIENQLPRFVLGLFAGPSAVGLYSVGVRICSIIQDSLIQPILLAAYPAIARTRSNPEDQKLLFEKIVFALSLLIFPCVVGIIFTAPLFVPLVLGDVWTESIHIVQIFSIVIASQSVTEILKSVLRVNRLINSCLYTQTFVATLAAVLFFLVAEHGPVAVVIVKLCASLLLMVAISVITQKLVVTRILSSYAGAWPAILSSVLMGVVLLLLSRTPFALHHILISLIIMVLVGIIAYFIFVCVFSPGLLKTAWRFVLKREVDLE